MTAGYHMPSTQKSMSRLRDLEDRCGVGSWLMAVTVPLPAGALAR